MNILLPKSTTTNSRGGNLIKELKESWGAEAVSDLSVGLQRGMLHRIAQQCGFEDITNESDLGERLGNSPSSEVIDYSNEQDELEGVLKGAGINLPQTVFLYWQASQVQAQVPCKEFLSKIHEYFSPGNDSVVIIGPEEDWVVALQSINDSKAQVYVQTQLRNQER